jgi:hypothetical protein
VRPQTSQAMSTWFVRMSLVRATTVRQGSYARTSSSSRAFSTTFCARWPGTSS